MIESVRRFGGLRLPLALLQVLLAVGLSTLGNLQTRSVLQWGMKPWDYIASAEVVLHSINFPVAVLVCVLTNAPAFEIGLEFSVKRWLLYLTLVAALWYWIGMLIEGKGLPIAGSWSSRLVAVIGVIFGLLLLITASSFLKGPHGGIIIASSFVWGAIILVISSKGILARSNRPS